MSFLKFVAASLVLMTTVLNSSAAPTPLPCVALKAGDYRISTVTDTPGLPLTIGESNVNFGNILITESNPSQPELGVWRLIDADQAGYHILNVGLARNVTTFHFTPESGLIMPVVSPANTPADTYAVQCAGGGEYVIKVVNDDLLFTTTDSNTPGISNIELLPSTGSRTQHWKFVAA